VFCVLGLGSYLFVELLARRLRRRAYRVESLERQSGATELAQLGGLAGLATPTR